MCKKLESKHSTDVSKAHSCSKLSSVSIQERIAMHSDNLRINAEQLLGSRCIDSLSQAYNLV